MIFNTLFFKTLIIGFADRLSLEAFIQFHSNYSITVRIPISSVQMNVGLFIKVFNLIFKLTVSVKVPINVVMSTYYYYQKSTE